MLAQLVGVFKQFVAIRAYVRFFRDVSVFGQVLGKCLFSTDGMSFDHVHLIERFGREPLRAIIALVFEFDERVHILVSLFQVTLKNDVVAEVYVASRTSECFRLDVLLFDVILK